MQSLPRTSKTACNREGKVVLPAIRGGMHTACTSANLRMDISAKAETIYLETPRAVKDRICVLRGAWGSFWVSVSVDASANLWNLAFMLRVKV